MRKTTRPDSGKYKLILTNSSGTCESIADVVVLGKCSHNASILVIQKVFLPNWRKEKNDIMYTYVATRLHFLDTFETPLTMSTNCSIKMAILRKFNQPLCST